MEKEWLESKFKTHTRQEIADMADVSLHIVKKYLKEHNIKKPKKYEDVFNDKDWLENEYETKSIQMIADEIGCSKKYVFQALKKFNIDTTKHGRIDKNTEKLLKNKLWLSEQFSNKTINQISKELNVSDYTVRKYLSKHNITDLSKHKKISTHSQKYLTDPAWLRRMYKIHTMKEIGEITNTSTTTVSIYMKKLDIDSKDIPDTTRKILENKQQLLELYQTYGSIKDLSRILNVSTTTITNYMDMYGIHHGPISKETLEILNDKERMDELYSKMSTKEIAVSIGTTKKTVSKFLKLHDISLNRYRTQSSVERDIISKFPEEKIEYNVRTLIPSRNTELDIYFPDHNFGIEVDGHYWHSESKKGKNYHQRKMKSFLNHGIDIMQIWDYEWEDPRKQEIIISMIHRNIGKSIKIAGVEVSSITSTERNEFLEKNHLEGDCTGNSYGLFSEGNELICIAVFNENEILRISTKNGICALSGYEKIIETYMKEYPQYETLIHRGNMRYGNPFLHVPYSITSPNPLWIRKNSNIVEKILPKDENEYVKVYDSGNFVFEFTK